MSEMNDFNQRVITEFRSNQGKVSGQFAKMPLLLLTTTGAKTGRALTKPLAYTRDAERIVLIASFAGAPKNPAWFNNLVANRVVTIELGSERFQARATVTSGEERERLYKSQAQQMSIFADYQKKTTRQIPVVVLQRIG
ncbi:MAG: nitroreductase family deazaflavin-dependent oxidoreductase [Candidatus Binataceae bacterium]